MIFLNIKLWLPVWTGSKGQIGVTFLKYWWQFDHGQILYLIYLLRCSFKYTGSKGQIWGHFKLTINDLYNGVKNCEFTSCGCWDMIFLIVNFDFRFGQEVKVKLGSPFCKYFLTINDLYNGAKIVNLPLAVVEIWFFKY